MRAVQNQLFTVICLMITDTGIQSEHSLGPMSLTSKQKADMVDHHNKLRRQEGSSNMELMTWKESLGETAMILAQKCEFDHWVDAVKVPSGEEVPRRGQNLAMNTVKFESYTWGIQQWYDEKTGYNYNTRYCDIKKVPKAKTCGHYTQVVWATSSQVGCAYVVCDGLKEGGNPKTREKTFYLVCDYLPGGNMQDNKDNTKTLQPYKKGPFCSQCTSGAGWCSDKLCNKACTAEGEGCSCAARCHNCAKLDEETCRCKCAKGWTGTDCRTRCEDRREECGANPGWPRRWCEDPQYAHQMVHCPALCGKCKADPNAEAGKCDPVLGKSADTSQNPSDEDTSSTATTTFNMTEQQLMLMTIVMMMAVMLLRISSN